ncbi:MFS transporter [Rhodopseudomonas sp. HC1]|uniref:NTP/NDP exchange transporter n=1 Tax=Rhodopseudomonas infernalis TaxID=2897386 RepID=UPI001EE7BE63|nr:MFS transporter [Rhodopseudomonas infernalis]MCG6207470.1 MFS transporter [Rhodopseudomonas infernalis]
MTNARGRVSRRSASSSPALDPTILVPPERDLCASAFLQFCGALSVPAVFQDSSTPMFPSTITRLLNIERSEAAPVIAGFLMQFSLFVCYFAMRPIRETMGVVGGVNNLQWLFTATFVATLAVSPLFGWLVSRAKHRNITRWALGFFGLNILGFALAIHLHGETVWLARVFFVWLSVFNLMAISLAWSVLVDVFDSGQARRLFAMMAAGASLGGLVGPLIGVLFVTHIGNAGLLVVAASMLVVTAFCADHLLTHHVRPDRDNRIAAPAPESRLGGNPFEGAVHVFTSPLLLGIALFVVLLASVSTFLYFEQARFVAERFTDRAEQTRFFSSVDAVVQFLTLLIQVFLTGRIASTLGIRVLLLTVPILMTAGFLMLSVSTMLGMYVVVMVIRRVGEYALVRPGREMLFTAVPTADKYKAKSFIDTVVYRGADAVSGWVKAASDMLLTPQMGAVAGAILAFAWMFSGVYTLRQHRRAEERVV